MAQIRHKGANRYLISVYLGRGSDGKRQYHNEMFYGTKPQARVYAAELEVKLKRRVGPAKSAMTLGEFLQEKWLPGIRASVSARTFETYSQHVNRLIPAVGHLPLYGLAGGDLQECLAGLQGLSPITIRKLVGTLKTALRQGAAWGKYGITADAVSGLRTPRVPRKRRRVLTKEELHRLLAAARDFKHYPVIRLLALTGIRLGEALGLKWDDVDFERSRILIRRSIDTKARDFKPEGDEAKTANSERPVALDPETMAILAEMKREKMKGKVSPLKLGDTLVFGDGTRPVRHEAINRTLSRALKKAGLDHIRVHDLRHTAGSLLLDAGLPLTFVADALGQVPETTARVYAHAVRRQDRSAAEILLQADQEADRQEKTQ